MEPFRNALTYLRDARLAKKYLSEKPSVISRFGELFEQHAIRQFELTPAEFSLVLADVITRHARAHPDPCEFIQTLNVGDLALARACAAGRNNAWSTLIRRFRPQAYSWARQMVPEVCPTRSAEFVDSLWADLYLTTSREGRMYSQLAYFGGLTELGAWLRRVAHNKILNFMYRYWTEDFDQHTHKRVRQVTSVEQIREDEPGFDLPAQHIEFSGRAAEKRLRTIVRSSIAALSQRERVVMNAFYVEERTTREIGRALGVKGGGTVSQSRKSGLSKLREELIYQLQESGFEKTAIIQIDARSLNSHVLEQLSLACSPLQDKLTRQEQQDKPDEISLGDWRDAVISAPSKRPSLAPKKVSFYNCRACGWSGTVKGRPRCLACARRRAAAWRLSVTGDCSSKPTCASDRYLGSGRDQLPTGISQSVVSQRIQGVPLVEI